MAHPRSRGENLNLGGVRPDMAGSSPLTRGKHSPRAGYSASRRLIPAHAGKTGLARRRPARARAHPRSRGENAFHAPHRGTGPGSSPLTRGKRETGRSDVSLIRLIPAHAGKTLRSARLSSPGWAHPRSRGENSMVTVTRAGSRGSSPLTRGKLAVVLGSAHRRGLIPAHAGKTSIRSSRLPISRAHPRSRGENVMPVAAQIGQAGSSPLTRGKLTRPTPSQSRRGLIPAHAGKTDRRASCLIVQRAHPRSRGENEFDVKRVPDQEGSSPLTRGKRARDRPRG